MELNPKDFDFIQTVLWQIKNLFRKTKMDNNIFKPPAEFVNTLAVFIQKLFQKLSDQNKD